MIRRAASSRTRAARRRPRSPGATRSNATSSWPATARRWCSTISLLDRLTQATGRVDGHSAAELGEVGFKECAETIPALSAFLDEIGGRTPLIVEIKSAFDGDCGSPRAPSPFLPDYEGPAALEEFRSRRARLPSREGRGSAARPRGAGLWGVTTLTNGRSLRPSAASRSQPSAIIRRCGRISFPGGSAISRMRRRNSAAAASACR